MAEQSGPPMVYANLVPLSPLDLFSDPNFLNSSLKPGPLDPIDPAGRAGEEKERQVMLARLSGAMVVV
ncbi:MAG TPA: hypothetical protein VJ935_04140, partial [Acidimicrobiia bacterium]|nr:hypothetical protein [Acidimicrobiia bacterium]